MPSLNPHSLRHYFASTLIAKTVPITEVSAMMGHANSQITMTVYAHLIKD